VRVVDEQKVAVGQLVEHGEVRGSEWFAMDAVAELIDFRAWPGVDGHDPCFKLAIAPRAGRELGRAAGTST
jgi:hypothetical protein